MRKYLEKTYVVAIDAMGGNNAPDAVIDGVKYIIDQKHKVKFLIFGDELIIKNHMVRHHIAAEYVEVIHCDDIVADNEKPSSALRRDNTSMRMAVQAVKDGQADCVVSSGNTGAFMALSMFILKRMPMIDRPAIACFIPTMTDPVSVLDVGANVSADAKNLLEFSIMGKLFYEAIYGDENPRIGLLNVGEEDVKGHEAVKEASQMLRTYEDKFNYVGFVEGDFLSSNLADIIVTDGFTGNIVLKSIEGTAKVFTGSLSQAFRADILSRFAYIMSYHSMRKLRKAFDPRLYNGALILGLDGIAVKSHGSADKIGFANAIKVAINLAQHDFLNEMSETLQTYDFSDLTEKTI